MTKSSRIKNKKYSSEKEEMEEERDREKMSGKEQERHLCNRKGET